MSADVLGLPRTALDVLLEMFLHRPSPDAIPSENRGGRAGGIRTRGLFVPNEALYQAEPQPVKRKLTKGPQRRSVNEKRKALVGARRAGRGLICQKR